MALLDNYPNIYETFSSAVPGTLPALLENMKTLVKGYAKSSPTLDGICSHN